MQWRQKLLNRFNHFEKNFEYIGFERKNKRTILKIKCLTCNEVLEKEQFNLLNKRKEVCCFVCVGRKYPKRVTKKDIIKKCDNEKSTYISHNRDSDKLQLIVKFVCRCGKTTERDYYSVYRLRCVDCNFKNRSWSNQYKEEDIRKWMISKDITPTFDTYDGKNAQTRLEYICICGKESTIPYMERFRHEDSWQPMCKNCAMIKKTSKENHWNWKGGLTGYRKSHEKSTTWSRNVKKLYDNTCIITGQTYSLVSHHLNAFSTNVEDRNKLINGVCISSDTHKEFHKKYDSYKGTCTIEDFMEFYKYKTGKDFKKIMETIYSKLEFIKSLE
jgi:hypothetical protein